MSLKFLVIPLLFLLSLSSTAHAQATGLLYDPQPPADSAYVRIIHAASTGNIDLRVDDRPRLRGLAAGSASDYMVLPAGKHTLSLHAAGQAAPLLSTPLDVNPGRAISVAFTTLKHDTKPIIVEDRANSNKLKAVIGAYHLAPEAGTLDILTADGSTKVFPALAPNTSTYLTVNPISVALMAAASGEKEGKAKTSISMEPGATYSVLLLQGEKGKLVARALQNKVERYTGK